MAPKTLILLAFVFYLTTTIAAAAKPSSTFIKTSCATVDYPALCEKSLSPFAKTIKHSPAELARTALAVTLKQSESTLAYLNKLKRLKGLKPRESGVVGLCLDLVSSSLDDISNSIKELKTYDRVRGKEFVRHMNNVLTWVSAVLTDETTCMDEFGGRAMDGRVKSSVRAHLTSLAQFTNFFEIDFIQFTSNLQSKQIDQLDFAIRNPIFRCSETESRMSLLRFLEKNRESSSSGANDSGTTKRVEKAIDGKLIHVGSVLLGHPQPGLYRGCTVGNTAERINFKSDPQVLANAKKETGLRYTLGPGLTLPNDVAWWCDRTPNPEPCKHFMATKTTHNSALTNIETCRAGFVELNASDYMLPLLMNNNVTKLISNALAINNNITNGFSEGFRGGFPSWFKAGDRRLLRAAIKADVVVAQDGSGDYRTVKAAVEAAGKRSGSGRFVIYVKNGVYRENVEIGNKMKNITMVGDGRKHTIITGSRSVGGGTSNTTFYSATVIIIGSGFIARGITFRNTAGPQNHQAVALLSTSDQSVFYRCGFEGYQDTLYVHSNSQFYKECYVYGTVDFIFGNAAVIFQNCMIYGRRPMASQKITITAQGRTKSNQNTGIVIQNSRIMAALDLKPVLGLVDSAEWLEWDGNFALNTLYYGEYRNTGPGSSTSRRVKWRRYRVITSSNEASRFTVANFIAGQSWFPNTKVPFTAGL
ncbi:hypothetical protein OSB04_026238 [Centaurea solstitialis]|uniref:Pectinesterase n=1 Tax=Centaurea solstitialis TaxID=347529 RepID=A0AA38VYJ7_9ASTR|nr:hypothetical protein OSB04_026238 [Centaurea solstitialis]